MARTEGEGDSQMGVRARGVIQDSGPNATSEQCGRCLSLPHLENQSHDACPTRDTGRVNDTTRGKVLCKP